MLRTTYPDCPFWCLAPGKVKIGGHIWSPRVTDRAKEDLAWVVKQVFVERATCPEVRRGHRFHLVAELSTPSRGKDGWVYAIHGTDALTEALRSHYRLGKGCALTDPTFVLVPRFAVRNMSDG